MTAVERLKTAHRAALAELDALFGALQHRAFRGELWPGRPARRVQRQRAGCPSHYARRVTAVERLKAAHRAALAELDALFATLQHRAFRGEL